MTRGRAAWDVVVSLAIMDFRLKYHDSLRGYLWSMAGPLLMVATYTLVFEHILEIAIPGYLPYLLVGIVYWTFFQDCTYSGLAALTSRGTVLKSVSVPVTAVVAGSAASTMIPLAINTGVLAVILLVTGRLSPLAPLVVVPIACLILLATGIALLVAVAHVRFRDTGIVWGVALQAWFWLTPVVYMARDGMVAEALSWNPLARCLDWIRWVLLHDTLPHARFALVTVLSSVAVFAAGAGAFLRRQATIPERL